ncbi:MAG: PLP-dependent aminotransferase family protein, partial [Candidatus Omnitrophica bacterium]|nr:PLP-dependent aminotransferase family protein [Candidatus Omnitrophota bacterium]
MLILNLDRNSDIPLFKQVFHQLKEKIDSESLKPGYVLPPTRTFADHLGVNRTTIYKAYQELWAFGYIESRSGSYSYVRQRRELKSPATEKKGGTINWANRVNPQSEEVHIMFGNINYPFSEEREKFEGIDFGRLHPDTRIFPVKEFNKSLSRIIAKESDMVFDYGECNGLISLREYIASRLRSHSISVSSKEILITNGAQNALDLLMKLLVKSGSRVFVESPTYGMIFPLLKYYNCEIVEIPMKKDGVDLAVLESELKKGIPIFFYTMPNFQ